MDLKAVVQKLLECVFTRLICLYFTWQYALGKLSRLTAHSIVFIFLLIGVFFGIFC